MSGYRFGLRGLTLSLTFTPTPPQLIFIDMHEEWCGPCDALAPTLTRVFAEYDACTERMTVCSASISKLGEHIQKALPSDAPVHLEKNGCLPAFALFRHNQCVGVISGVDGPAIISAISNNIPDKPIAVAAD